jgi:signal transduction histidine kinase
VTVRREGELIKVAVALGPDSSASSRMEQAWLHRMATRHGGKLVLGAGEVALELPGDASDERREVEGLRRELAAAQEQGEAYARELASMFARTDTSMPPPSSLIGADLDESFTPVANLARQLAIHLRPDVVALAKETPRAQVVATWLGALARFADAAEGEDVGSAQASDLIALAPDVERAARQRGVTVEITPPPGAARVRVREAAAVAALLIAHAVEATPRGGRVLVSGLVADDGLTITVDDGGSRVPIAARTAFVALDIDPTTLGRPPGVELFLADALIRRRNGSLRLEDAEVGVRFEAFVPSR